MEIDISRFTGLEFFSTWGWFAIVAVAIVLLVASVMISLWLQEDEILGIGALVIIVLLFVLGCTHAYLDDKATKYVAKESGVVVTEGIDILPMNGTDVLVENIPRIVNGELKTVTMHVAREGSTVTVQFFDKE